MREFIFLVMEKRPVLQPYLDLDATGPLTADEIEVAIDRLDEAHDQFGEPLTGEYRKCVLAEAEKRAHDAGDPETLDPGAWSSCPLSPGISWMPSVDEYSSRKR